METPSPEFVDDLFRFALLQTGDRQHSLEVLVEALANTADRAHQWRTQAHCFLWAAQFVSKQLEKTPPRKGADLDEVLAEAMQDPRSNVRAALALGHLGRVNSAEAIHLFRVRAQEMRVASERFRARTTTAGWTETETQSRINALKLSEEERAKLLEAMEAFPTRRGGVERKLGMAAVLLGVVVLGGWMRWEQWREGMPAQMQQFMGRLLEAHKAAGDGGLERFHGTAGETADWLFLHGMEGVQVPEAFTPLPLGAARVVDWNGGKLAQFPLPSLPGIFMVTETDTLKLSGEHSASGRAHWGEWSGAWMVSGPYAFFLTLRGSEDALEPLLHASFPSQTNLPAFERIVRWFSGE
jgi:hypothetical protein